MNKTLTTLLTLSIAASSTLANTPKGLAAGEKVLRKEGTESPYIAKYTVDVEGRRSPVFEKVFLGDSLVQKANGQCVLVRVRMQRMEEVEIGGGLRVQNPVTTTSSKPVPCIA